VKRIGCYIWIPRARTRSVFHKKTIPHFCHLLHFSVTLLVLLLLLEGVLLLAVHTIHTLLVEFTMPVGGGFARFSRMPPPRKEGDAVESVKETPVSQKDDSKVDSDMQQSWTDSIVDEAPNEKRFDDFGDDFGLPMDNLGGGMDFDNNADESLMGAWGETEVCNV
jgi:hypothetical protein